MVHIIRRPGRWPAPPPSPRYKQAQSNHLLALVVFAIVLFIVIYVVAKVYKLGRHILG